MMNGSQLIQRHSCLMDDKHHIFNLDVHESCLQLTENIQDLILGHIVALVLDDFYSILGNIQ